jgi:SAM-dependent methyltransferase
VQPALVTDFSALPFEENSLDLVVLPHSLELNLDPHTTLREVERVLVPEGKVVICCLNPASLWGLRQRRAHLYRRLGVSASFTCPMPASSSATGGCATGCGCWFRGRDQQLRLLPAGVGQREMAGTLRLDGRRRRALVADLRRRLFHRRRQARARRPPDRARLR